MRLPQSQANFLKQSLLTLEPTSEVYLFGSRAFRSECRSPMKIDPKELQMLLLTHWDVLQRSLMSLQQSTNKTRQLLQQSEFSFEELESIDSLTSKFSRTSDIYLQKVLRSIWMLLREDTVPLIDLLNRAEKLMIIVSAEELLQMRDIRNQIAHEYLPEAVPELASEVVVLTTLLQKNIEQTERFLGQRGWLE